MNWMIEMLEPDHTEEALGVWITPDSNNRQMIQELMEKSFMQMGSTILTRHSQYHSGMAGLHETMISMPGDAKPGRSPVPNPTTRSKLLDLHAGPRGSRGEDQQRRTEETTELLSR